MTDAEGLTEKVMLCWVIKVGMEWHVWDLRERQSGISKSKYEGSREEPGEG